MLQFRRNSRRTVRKSFEKNKHHRSDHLFLFFICFYAKLENQDSASVDVILPRGGAQPSYPA